MGLQIDFYPSPSSAPPPPPQRCKHDMCGQWEVGGGITVL